jgi:sorbose reductase
MSRGKATDWSRSDVTNFDVLKKTFDEIVKDFGRIDGL